MRYADYARAVLEYISATETHAGTKEPLRLDAARAAAGRWEAAARAFEQHVAAGEVHGDLRAVNARLMAVARALTEPAGLRDRPFFKHLLVAPQPTYRSEYLPRIWEAIDRGDRGAIAAHEAELVQAFDAAAGLLRDAAAMP
ncbi:MAG: transferrin receptor-like dimerization domain-containing protein [Gammaproteobacteria bacterium]